MQKRRVTMAEGHIAFPKKKWVRWTAAMRDTFLDHLAATCNVQASAAFIGVDPGSLYILRRREPAFADAWHEALALGYEMLETQLVGHALAGDEGAMLTNGVDTRMGPISVDLALRLLTLHRDATGKPRRGGPRRQRATEEETDKALMKKLTAIETRRAKDALQHQAATALPPPATGETRR